MDWLGPATAIGLIFLVSGLVSIAQAIFRPSRSPTVLRKTVPDDRNAADDAGHGHGHGYHGASPGLDADLHDKVDELLQRVPRSTFWRNTTWAFAGYGLAKVADFGLFYFFDV